MQGWQIAIDVWKVFVVRILEAHTLLRTGGVLIAVSVIAFAIGQLKILLPGLLCLTALLFAAACIDRIEAGDRLGVEQDWGGLGTGPGGWRLSPSLAYLAAAVLFGALSVAGLGIIAFAEGKSPLPDSRGAVETSRPDKPTPERSAQPQSDGPAHGTGLLQRQLPAVPAR